VNSGGGAPGPCLHCGGLDRQRVQHGVRDFEYGAPGVYDWFRCNGCGLVRVAPLPSAEVLALAYPASYHAYQAPRSRTTRWLRSRALAAAARNAVAGLPSRSSILDVGCASGDLLVQMGHIGDHRLYGVEFDRAMAEVARSRGITVCGESIEDADLPDGAFDLAVMQHVLEHVLDPVLALRRVRRSLKPGGRLVGELPNLRCWDAALFGRYWGGGHAPRHITHFTPRTLGLVLAQTGFGDVRVLPSLHTGHAALSLQNWIRRNRADTRGLICGRAAWYPILLLAMLPPNILAWPFSLTGVMRFEARAR